METQCPFCRGVNQVTVLEPLRSLKQNFTCGHCHRGVEMVIVFFSTGLDNDQDEIRRKICRLMEARGIKQVELARLVDVSHAYINQLVRGKRRFTLHMARRCLEALDCYDLSSPTGADN